MHQLNTLRRRDRKTKTPFLQRIQVNPEACKRNFESSAHLILAEPIYIALQMAGFDGDAHALVNDQATPVAQRETRPLIEVLEDISQNNFELAKAMKQIPDEVRTLFYQPEKYIGLAEEKALQIAELADSFFSV
jgi:adenylosuccinate lyase